MEAAELVMNKDKKTSEKQQSFPRRDEVPLIVGGKVVLDDKGKVVMHDKKFTESVTVKLANFLHSMPESGWMFIPENLQASVRELKDCSSWTYDPLQPQQQQKKVLTKKEKTEGLMRSASHTLNNLKLKQEPGSTDTRLEVHAIKGAPVSQPFMLQSNLTAYVSSKTPQAPADVNALQPLCAAAKPTTPPPVVFVSGYTLASNELWHSTHAFF